ncbi:MAG: tetratricopeptide repeat protein [Sphingobacteriales bacterium]|nr:tetratricopeptide repeat protein [Sphingobacteriales bacterium]
MGKKKQLRKQQQEPEAQNKVPIKKNKVPKAANHKFNAWLPALVVVLITLVVFIPSLQYGFVNWDDPENLTKNEHLKLFAYEWNWEAVKSIFTSDVMGNYNPLPLFTFAVEKYFFAKNPADNTFIFHFDNLWMHLLCTLFVFIILFKLGLSRAACFIGALLFGIHPMRIESVVWVTERKDVLYGMFFLAALIAYLKYVQDEKMKTKWYVIALVLSVFSYFAKIQAVTLPLSMVAIDFLLKRKWYSPKILIIEKLPWWILSLVFGLINIYFLKANKSIDPDNASLAYTFIDRLAVGAYSYAVYLIKFIYPYQMSPLYPYPEKLPAEAFAALAIVPILIIAFLVWAFKKKKTSLIFGWAFFTFNVMFLLQILAAGQGFLADRFTYIAYTGLLFLLAKLYDWLSENKPDVKKFALAGYSIYFLLFLFLTNKQMRIWENGGVLWDYVKAEFPANPVAWRNAGFYYRDEEKDFNKGEEYFKKAISLDSTNQVVYNSLAKVYVDKCLSLPFQTPNLNAEKQRLAELALFNYNRAERFDSINKFPDKKTSSEIIVNKGVAYALLNNFDLALFQFSKGLALDSLNKNAYLNRSLIYLNRNQFNLAVNDYNKILIQDSTNADIYYERGNCYNQLSKYSEALADFNKAISLKETQPLYYIGRARAYKQLGNVIASKADAMHAKQTGGDVPADLLQ